MVMIVESLTKYMKEYDPSTGGIYLIQNHLINMDKVVSISKLENSNGQGIIRFGLELGEEQYWGYNSEKAMLRDYKCLVKNLFITCFRCNGTGVAFYNIPVPDSDKFIKGKGSCRYCCAYGKIPLSKSILHMPEIEER